MGYTNQRAILQTEKVVKEPWDFIQSSVVLHFKNYSSTSLILVILFYCMFYRHANIKKKVLVLLTINTLLEIGPRPIRISRMRDAVDREV